MYVFESARWALLRINLYAFSSLRGVRVCFVLLYLIVNYPPQCFVD